MVVSSTPNINEKAVLEIAPKKLFQTRENNPDCKRIAEQLYRRAAAMRGNAIACGTAKRGITFGKTTYLNNGCLPSCMYKGVTDILLRRNELFTFKETCAILGHCNIDENLPLIVQTIRKYGIVIFGFPECPEEDLPIALYFFFEETFGIQPKIELCWRVTVENEPDIVDVIFDNIATKQEVAEKSHILDDTGIKIDTDFNISWIIDSMCCKDYDDADFYPHNVS